MSTASECNPKHLTSTGKGWAKRLRALGASESEIELLVARLREGMAAQITLDRLRLLPTNNDEVSPAGASGPAGEAAEESTGSVSTSAADRSETVHETYPEDYRIVWEDT